MNGQSKVITKTKYEQIFQHLKNQIENEYEYGYKMPPEPVLANELGVNKSTVSKALGFLQKEGYISRKPGVGTVVCFREAMQVTHVVTAIPFVETEFMHDVYFSSLCHLITNRCLEKDSIHSVVSIGNNQEKRIDFSKLHQVTKQNGISGVIVVGARNYEVNNIIDFCEETTIPMLWFGIRTDNQEINFIDTNNIDSTNALLDIAVSKGLRNIFMISKKIDTFNRQERYQSFSKRFNTRQSFVADVNSSFEAGYIGMKKILELETLPDCIFATDRGNLNGIRKTIDETGKGDNIPILSYDYYFDNDKCNVIASALPPLEKIAEEAVEFFIQKHHTPFQKIFKNRIITKKENGL